MLAEPTDKRVLLSNADGYGFLYCRHLGDMERHQTGRQTVRHGGRADASCAILFGDGRKAASGRPVHRTPGLPDRVKNSPAAAGV